MFYPRALNLFLYNVLLSHVVTKVSRITDGEHSKKLQISSGYKESESILKYLPIVGDYMTPNHKQILDASMDYVEFPRNMVYLNYGINAMVLIPAFIQCRWFGFLLSVILIWNLFIFERVFVFQLVLMWSLWDKAIRTFTYVLIIGGCTLMNGLHLILIAKVIKLQRDCLKATVAKAAVGHPVDGRGDEAMP